MRDIVPRDGFVSVGVVIGAHVTTQRHEPRDPRVTRPLALSLAKQSPHNEPVKPAAEDSARENAAEKRYQKCERWQFMRVTWSGELDLAPDAMYDAIRAHGRRTPV